jgi:hypothetical protein
MIASLVTVRLVSFRHETRLTQARLDRRSTAISDADGWTV